MKTRNEFQELKDCIDKFIIEISEGLGVYWMIEKLCDLINWGQSKWK